MSAHPRVLLVEDEVLVAALAADTLEELGYRAIEATTIKAALQIASDGEHIAFAVIDIGLPDGRGDGLAAQLLETRAGMPGQREEQVAIPIHVMPNGDTAGARGAALEALKAARQGGLQ